MDEQMRMTFFEHFDELRRRLFWVFIAIVAGTAVAWMFSLDYILPFLKAPVIAILDSQELELNYLSPIEPFMAKFKISILAGIFVASPLIFYHLLAFVAPALERDEKKVFYPLVILFVVLFLLGAFISYQFIMPLGTKWLLGQAGDAITPVLTVSQYLSFVMLFLFAFGLAFETPLAIIILVKVGLLKRATLRKNWRVVYVVLMVLAAVATPDWSLPPMLMLSAILIVLYEMSLLVTRFI